jgi:hypothetical protein
MTSLDESLQDFLRPLAIENHVAHGLSNEFADAFTKLSAESLDQFLPTPISESILRHVAGGRHGWYALPPPDQVV